jgi:hypothetical protein
VEEHQVDPIPLVSDAQSMLASDESEITAEFQSECLQLPDQSVLELTLRIFVLESEEFQECGRRGDATRSSPMPPISGSVPILGRCATVPTRQA